MARLNKNYADFFAKATSAGYGTNEIMSFVQKLFENPAGENERSRLKQGQASGTLRPDELSAKRSIEDADFPEQVLKGASNLALTVGGTGLAATKFSGLLNKGMGALGALGSALGSQTPQGTQTPQESEPAARSQPANPFQEFMQQHPELGAFLQREISTGNSPENAAMKAKSIKKFREPIASIEDRVGQPLESLLSQLFQWTRRSQADSRATQRGPAQQSAAPNPEESDFIQALIEFERLSGM